MSLHTFHKIKKNKKIQWANTTVQKTENEIALAEYSPKENTRSIPITSLPPTPEGSSNFSNDPRRRVEGSRTWLAHKSRPVFRRKVSVLMSGFRVGIVLADEKDSAALSLLPPRLGLRGGPLSGEGRKKELEEEEHTKEFASKRKTGALGKSADDVELNAIPALCGYLLEIFS
ncbi:hypothetical protein CDAR_65321 [Caerostris darwini]|uniref:Uncharacterized protein n=1 Tax=Caerostris darwini TaxID=1538125 RepID=A0AAV4PYC9_9ARAC|nr:hypothetical protein CDAR_65321 [Caerostris darwini]